MNYQVETKTVSSQPLAAVRRRFWPWSGTDEDPVTGGTHTFLAKYWASRLAKTKMKSFQSSRRTGFMEVELVDGKLRIQGQAVIVFEGRLTILKRTAIAQQCNRKV